MAAVRNAPKGPLIFGIPLAGLFLLAVSWLGQHDLSDLGQAEGRITA